MTGSLDPTEHHIESFLKVTPPKCPNLHKFKMAANNLFSRYLENHYPYFNDLRVDYDIFEGKEFEKIILFSFRCTILA